MAWRKASEHYCGQGIGDEADISALKQARANCIKAGNFKEAGIVDMIAQGAGWPPARRAAL
eukprot:4317340-Lingulodinium_polyedra.AAC.1